MGPQGTLDWPLRRALQLRANAPAILDGQRRFSYADLARRTAGLSSGLRSLGLSSGDRVAALAFNSFRHLELWMGVPPANLVVNDLNFRLAVPELEFILNDSGARALVTDRAHWEHADELRRRCPALEALVWADEGPAPGEAVHWDDVCAAEPLPADHPELAAISGDTLAAISYTGGTTGRPKGVMQTHGNLIANAKHTLLQNPLHVTDRFLHSSPMFHAAGVANIYGLTWVAGTHVIAPGFEPEAFGRIVEDERVTVAVLVPTMLNMLLNHPGTAARDLSSWRLLIYAASPMPIGLLRRALDALPCDFAQGYGMTEASPHVAGSSPADHRRALEGDPDAVIRLASCGPPAIGVDVEIRSADGARCAPGEVGEIVLRGPNVMPGYWNRPDETAAAFTPDGFYRSGDLAYADDEGYLFIVDRSKDMVISGGENVYTVEVENALMMHPAVLEAAVFGVPHEQWGEAVHAEVAIKPGARVTADELLAECRRHVAGFKVPRSLSLRSDPLPKSGAGKILKRDLRQARLADLDA